MLKLKKKEKILNKANQYIAILTYILGLLFYMFAHKIVYLLAGTLMAIIILNKKKKKGDDLCEY